MWLVSYVLLLNYSNPYSGSFLLSYFLLRFKLEFGFIIEVVGKKWYTIDS